MIVDREPIVITAANVEEQIGRMWNTNIDPKIRLEIVDALLDYYKDDEATAIYLENIKTWIEEILWEDEWDDDSEIDEPEEDIDTSQNPQRHNNRNQQQAERIKFNSTVDVIWAIIQSFFPDSQTEFYKAKWVINHIEKDLDWVYEYINNFVWFLDEKLDGAQVLWWFPDKSWFVTINEVNKRKFDSIIESIWLETNKENMRYLVQRMESYVKTPNIIVFCNAVYSLWKLFNEKYKWDHREFLLKSLLDLQQWMKVNNKQDSLWIVPLEANENDDYKFDFDIISSLKNSALYTYINNLNSIFTFFQSIESKADQKLNELQKNIAVCKQLIEKSETELKFKTKSKETAQTNLSQAEKDESKLMILFYRSLRNRIEKKIVKLTNTIATKKSKKEKDEKDYHELNNYIDELHSHNYKDILELDKEHLSFYIEKHWWLIVNTTEPETSKAKKNSNTWLKQTINWKKIALYAVLSILLGSGWVVVCNKVWWKKADQTEQQAWSRDSTATKPTPVEKYFSENFAEHKGKPQDLKNKNKNKVWAYTITKTELKFIDKAWKVIFTIDADLKVTYSKGITEDEIRKYKNIEESIVAKLKEMK